MLDLVNQTMLPDEEEYAGVGSSAGIALDTLKQLQAEWTTTFDWNQEQATLNKSVRSNEPVTRMA